jgi:hypothetical protein
VFAITCDGVMFTQEFVPPIHVGIQPGATFLFSVRLQQSAVSSSGAGGAACRSLRLAAVIFEDGRAEGDEQTVGELRAMRLGRLLQLNQMLPLIQQLSAGDHASRIGADDIEPLRRRVAAMPLEVNGKHAEGYLATGMQAAQSELTRGLGEILRSDAAGAARDHRDDLLRIQRLSEEKAGALQKEGSH